MALVNYKRSEIQLKIVFVGASRAAVRNSMSEIYESVYGAKPDYEREKALTQSLSSSLEKLFGKKASDKSQIDTLILEFGAVQGYKIIANIQGLDANLSPEQLNAGLKEADHVIFVVDQQTESPANLSALEALNRVRDEDAPLTLQYNSGLASDLSALKSALGRTNEPQDVEEGLGTVEGFRAVMKDVLIRLS